MPDDRAQTFLQMIRRSQRGRLKVYLGYGPGVGKTYRMLLEAHRLKGEGIDIVVGFVETHGRPETAKLIEGLEVVPRRKAEYHDIVVEEMDLDAVIKRHPQVAIVDELAHTNVPGSKNAKRYQDVQDILAAGIHVISALNIQHLESLYNTVEQLIGVKVRERLPDSVLAEADQIINIDLSAEDLQQRLREGKIYPAERVQTSLDNFFTNSNLEHLRELALREVASQLDFKRRETAQDKIAAPMAGVPDQIMVCLSSRGPNSARLLRFASRLAGRLNRNWYAVYVQTPSEEPTVIDAVTQRLLADTLTLANQLGAMVFTFKGQNVADTILRFAREYRVGQIVIGRPRPVPWWKRLIGHGSVAQDLVHRSQGVTIIVVDAESEERTTSGFTEPSGAPNMSAVRLSGTLSRLLTPQRIIIWEDPAARQDVRQRLVNAIVAGEPRLDAATVIAKLAEREQQGSTFLNEGIALPHARLENLEAPQVALGLTRAGLLDLATERPIEAVFLLLSPMTGANVHLQLLAKAGRALQNRELRNALDRAGSPAEALEAIQDFEAASSGQTVSAAAR
jgi:two-component system sensor histidine kinase KdpD